MTNFHEHILNGFQLIEQKQNYCQTSKGNNSKTYINKSYTSCGLHIIWWCFIFLLSFMKISWKAFYLLNSNETTIVKFHRRITPVTFLQPTNTNNRKHSNWPPDINEIVFNWPPAFECLQPMEKHFQGMTSPFTLWLGGRWGQNDIP